MGKIVEMKKTVKVGDLQLSVNSPAIITSTKYRFWFDNYEKEEREAVKKFLESVCPVIELGGGIGAMACFINKKLTNPKKHIVVEANPNLANLIEENRLINDCNFTVINRVLGYGGNEIPFYIDKIYVSGSAKRKTSESIVVPAITLKEIIDRYGFDIAALICDIEGSEIELVDREINTLSEKVNLIIMETHSRITGKEAVEKMLRQLQEQGFEKIFSSTDAIVLKNKKFNNKKYVQ
jgi:FkbM family methyltransferase